MRQETINIFKYEELNDEAKEKARQWFSNGQEYHWCDEAINSLEAILELFRARINDYSLSPYSHSYIDIEFFCDDIENLKGIRAYKWIKNNIEGCKGQYGDILKEWYNCPLTGYCGDYDALEPIHKFMTAPSDITINELLQQSAEAIKEHIIKDMEYQDSQESIEENIIINDYEFTETGDRY
jgi:hypothetical protein